MAEENRQNKQTKWLCLGESVRGASHKRTGLPNQDAISWWPQKAVSPYLGEGPPLILAVSDGHGSPKNFRSDVGSQKAVEIATTVIGDFFLEGESEVENFSTIKDKAQNLLPQRLAHEWKKSVEKHWEKSPVTEEEWERVMREGGSSTRQAIEENPSIAYGATLLAVLVTAPFILYLQLGDGDILCVDSSGKTTRPLKRDPRLIANETTSLCTSNAWREFQVSLVSYQESPSDGMPTLILVATDGYANSYPSEEEFIKIGQDYREMSRQNGIIGVWKQLEHFLKETSAKGSGDDITLGIISRIEEGDWDYQNKRITANHEELVRHRDIMNTQQEQITDVDNRIKRLSKQQKKTGKALLLLLIGLIVTFPLALFSTVVSGVLYFRSEKMQSDLENLKQDKQTLSETENSTN